MSGSSKPGPCRIPSFGFRLPQLRSGSATSIATPTTPTETQHITATQSRIPSGFRTPSLRGSNSATATSSSTTPTEGQPPECLNLTKPIQKADTAIPKNVLIENNKSEHSLIKNTIKKLVQSVSSSHSKGDSVKPSQVLTNSDLHNVANQRLASKEENNLVVQPHVPKLTSKHLGKKVRLGDKVGVLRYVGIVHFAKGPWCGVELDQPNGKHDGSVNGVRYFGCAELRGLMAPLSKVNLIEGNCETLEDNVSGPYSMLFLDNTFTQKESKQKFTQDLDSKNRDTFNVEKQNTFELYDNPNFKENQNQTIVQEETEIKNQNTFNVQTTLDLQGKTLSVENINQTVNILKKSTFDLINNTRSIENLSDIHLELQGTLLKKGNSTCDIFHNLTHSVHGSNHNLGGNRTYDFIACSTESLNRSYDSKDAKNHLNHTITQELQNIPENQEVKKNHSVLNRQNTFEVVKIDENLTTCMFTNTKKRTNETFDCDNDTLTNIDNRREQQEAELTLHCYKSCEDLIHESTVEVKRRRTSNLRNTRVENIVLNNLPLTKPSSLPQLRAVHLLDNNTQRHSTPVRGGYTENVTKWRISDIKSEDSPASVNSREEIFILSENECHNKRDSLECEDCSLGILTPDQMPDFAQTRSPSLEYNPFDVSKLALKNGSGESGAIEKDSLGSKKSCTTSIVTPSIPIPTKSNHLETKEDLQSPNCTSITDYSLGIIDVQMLSTFNTLKTDTTMNLELPLDSVEQISKNLAITRCDQTPSPEDLPLDTTPIVESESTLTAKSELTHNTELTETSENLSSSQKSSKPSSSYVTSITTSITSLDTGYQGDGEMSRPASRGADNSPLTRRPLPRPQPRRPDPMTDSDFYTESDADNHEDNQYKESRRAQVIDGTLYGVDPQAAADIYVNNRENMDSSGIFTDIESAGNGINEEEEEEENEERITEKEVEGPVVVVDISPTESTTKSISVNSQDNIQELLNKKTPTKPIVEKGIKTPKELINPKKRNAPSPGLGSPASLNSPRHLNKENHENVAKKYKMPKRDVASKVKTMLDTNKDITQTSEKKITKKPAGRWDAVMNKISKNEQSIPNLKDVKSKVFNNVSLNLTPESRTSDVRKNSARTVGSQNTKSRRVRTRTSHASSQLKSNNSENNENSIHSSLSDLSAATSPPKKAPGSAKKRDTIQVTQVLTPNKLTRTQPTVTENNKKNAANSNLTPSPSLANDVKIKRNIFTSKEKRQNVNGNNVTKELSYNEMDYYLFDQKTETRKTDDCSKPTTKGGRTSPTVRPPSIQTNHRALNHQPPVNVKNQHEPPTVIAASPVQDPKAAEALAVLVHHLVFNVEAYQVPHLRRQVEKFRLEAEEIRLACQNLEETLSEERLKQSGLIEEERTRCRKDITDLIEKHRNIVEELTSQQSKILAEKEHAHQCLVLKHEEQLGTVRTELEKLQRSHQETLDILSEENDSIREQIDEKSLELVKVRYESLKLKDDYEKKEIKLKEDLESAAQKKSRLKHQLEKLEKEFEEKMAALAQENSQLREENDRLLSYGDEKGKGVVLQEVQSLRAVLELKQIEVTELRKSLAQASQKLEILSGAEERATTLQARCEDLQLQLHRKTEFEHSLVVENQKLQESIQEECNQKKRLYQYNEELHWKIKQNKEVITKVMEVMDNQGGEEEVFNRSNSIYSSSFNEKHGSTNRSNIERTYSFRERSLSNKSNISLDGLGSNNRTRKSKNSISELFDMDDVSPPTSPKVKGVVEKSDSVSYVLDLDESPEVVANRIVRRSFRNSTPPKNNTPTKSPSNKRPRMRNPLSMSASSSAIVTPTSGGSCQNEKECDRPRSASGRDGKDYNVFLWDQAQSTPNNNHSNDSMKIEDEDHLDLDDTIEDIQLPALPSEMDKRNGVLALPSPKHLAGDINNAASDSNSEDESTSSSQL